MADLILVWVSGLFSGVILTWLGAWFRKAELRRERATDLASELVGIASDDLERAKTLRAHIAIGCPSKKDLPDWLARVKELDTPRHENRAQMHRRCLQLRILVGDKPVTEAARRVANSQPFFYWQPALASPEESAGRLHSAEDEYIRGLDEYSKRIAALTERAYEEYQVAGVQSTSGHVRHVWSRFRRAAQRAVRRTRTHR